MSKNKAEKIKKVKPEKVKKERVKKDKKSKREKLDQRSKEVKWDKLDNTANLFPVITTESMSNVYRIAVTLKEDINRDILQEALEKVLPYFDVFNSRMRKGVFWYYFESNKKAIPKIKEEHNYPGMYIDPYANNSYMFRVSYYRNRINLEVFHALADGNGALIFLKELVYQYLRMTHPELKDKVSDSLSSEASLNKEDSYLKNYKKSNAKPYKTAKAYLVKGETLAARELGVIHGYIDMASLKTICKEKGITVNHYLISALFYSIYKEYLHEQPSKLPISACVPVNLRPYFDSNTIKNFFVVITASFKPEKEHYTFEDIIDIVSNDLKDQMTKENLEKLFSYNVANEKNLIMRVVPLFIKNMAMRHVYNTSAKANTTTVTNLGLIKVKEEYEEYIEQFHATLSPSKGQYIKGTVCSYSDTLVFTFSSILKDTSIQKTFFRIFVKDGVNVSIESNGVYYE